MSIRNLIKTWVYKRKSLLDPTKNYSQAPQKLAHRFRHKTILDVGAGKQKITDSVITLDRFEPADLKADAFHLPIKSNSVDLAFSIAVLEHLKEPKQAVDEIYRTLKKGGQVYIEIPFLQPFHSSPDDFYRATLPGLKHWCRDFQEIGSGVCVGPGSTIAWIEIEYIRLIFGRIPLLGLLVELLFRIWSLPLKFLDRLLVDHKDSHIIASAIFFHGKKT